MNRSPTRAARNGAAAVCAVIAVLACAYGCGDRIRTRRTLWPGSDYTVLDRQRAVQDALTYLYRSSQDKDNFANFAADYIWCFYTVSDTIADPNLGKGAREMGVDRARAWRIQHGDVPANATAEELYDLVSGALACDRLGEFNLQFRDQLAAAVPRHSSGEYMGFDPRKEPPPGDIPNACMRCGTGNARGATRCSRCGAVLTMRSRYDVWTDAMLTAYTGDSYKIPLGASYEDVIRWLPSMRPYPSPVAGGGVHSDAIYAVTHLVYTLNDYGRLRIPPEMFPEEVALLRAGVAEAIAARDPETVGECMDSLRAFGLTEDDAPIQAGMTFLFSTQRPSGTWTDSRDPYIQYHAAWTGLDALRGYIWKGRGPAEELRRMLAPPGAGSSR